MIESSVVKQEPPLLSVIIPTKNRAKYIERCLLSVFNEIETDYPNTEVIIIDGGSTDGTVEVLKQYAHKIAYWVSEPDAGVSDAVNKGLARANGEFIRFLGDDDELVSGWFKRMIDYLREHPGVDVVIAHADFYAENASGQMSPANIKQPIGYLTYRDFLRIGEIGWPSPEVAFTRHSVYQKFGGYDTHYHYLAYLEIWLRFAKNHVVFEAIPQVITKRFLTSDSDTIKGNQDKIAREFISVLKLHGDIRWKLTTYYPRRIKHILLSPVTALCQVLHIHPLRALRRIRTKLKAVIEPNSLGGES